MVSGDWRGFRPAIWLAMIGVALILLVQPPYVGVVFIGAGIGIGLRIRQRRRLAATAQAGRTRAGRRGRRRR